MPFDWQNWCRLCGKVEFQNAAIKIETIPNFLFIVQKHFAILVSKYCYYLEMSSTPNDFVYQFYFQLNVHYSCRKQIVQQIFAKIVAIL